MSGYGLPGTKHGHGYSHSYSNISLLPGKPSASSNTLLPTNGNFATKAIPNGNLYTHAETSRDTSPLTSPYQERESWHTPYEQNTYAFQANSRLSPGVPHHSHHTHSRSWSPMKSRARGESDLGRPAEHKSSAFVPSLDIIPAASKTWFSLPEALTALLIPLPYMLTSAAYSSISGEELGGSTHPLPAYATMQRGAGGQGRVLPKQKFSSDSGVIEACTLASGTLLLVGILGKLKVSERVLDRRKEPTNVQQQAGMLFSIASTQSMVLRALSLGLPFFAAVQIGGLRTGLVLLATVASALTSADVPFRRSIHDWLQVVVSRKATVAVILLCVASDFSGLTFHAPLTHMCLGYLALMFSAFVLPPPLPTLAASSAGNTYKDTGSGSHAVSILTYSPADVSITLVAGLLLSMLSIGISIFWNTAPSLKPSAIFFSTLAVGAMSAAILFSQPALLRKSDTRAGLGLGYFLTASCAFLYSPSVWPGTVANGGLSALSLLGVLYDTNASDEHIHEHTATTHTHHHHHDPTPTAERGYSVFTKLIMARCQPGSLVYSILSDKDSRRIAYFTILNFAFMIVQGIYGYISGSLGLLSDTVHMFFDCLGLVVGLGAAVASKWPTSPEKPYGWGKLNTLAGFGNGIFLMLVSVEFVWEAIEGIVERTELRHVKELLVVSTLGFLVNMVGLLAFGHAHAGHDHGHSHSHGHGHDHGHSQSPSHGHDHSHSHSLSHSHGHDHSHDYAHTNGHAHSRSHSHSHGHNHSHDHAHANGHAHSPAPSKPTAPAHHGHDHHNENMHGIFLHVAADAGGSLAVILSTGLTLWRPWYLWDPLATILIAILIFAAAVPLVTSSGQKLLLVVSDDLEYHIKNTLQELGELRGVVGYAVPRFWVDDQDSSSEGHDQNHHSHDHVSPAGAGQKIMGVVHVIAAHLADLEDVRERVEELARERGMDLVVHVEREAEGQCWCGGGPSVKSG